MTIWNQASFKILNERGDLEEQNRIEAWKFMDVQKQNVCRDDFFMKHKAEQKESALTMLPSMAFFCKVRHLKICNVDEGSELYESTIRRFVASSETLPAEKVLLRHSNLKSWNPIVIEDVASVDHIDRVFGKARCSSGKKLLKVEFENKKKLVRIANKMLRWTSDLVRSQLS